ncbi:MAG: response regulator [Deltaproteobacteria bacterium]|mgnify:CR=1 FL=1
MIKVAIVGAGSGGSALLDLFKVNGEVKVVGITDKRSDARGLDMARTLDVTVIDGIEGLPSCGPEIVINTTGDPSVNQRIRAAFSNDIEIIEGRGARLLWELVERQKRAKNDLSVLYQSSLYISRAKSLKECLHLVLKSAMELTETKAGSIALTQGSEMVMAAQLGLEPAFFKQPRWEPRDNGLTEQIIKKGEPIEFNDIDENPLFKGTDVAKGNIKAILAAPLLVNGGTIGILYLDDFRPRKFTERHKSLIKVFSSQVAYAIERFRLLHDLEESVSELEGIFSDSEDMIIAADNEGGILKFSKGGQRILGYSQNEVLGKNAIEFYREKDERLNIMKTLKEKGAVYNYETVLLRKDSTPVDISLTISQLRNKSGVVIGTVGVSKDITQEKRLRKELEELNRGLEDKVFERTRELERTNRELKRANELKGRFIANASHELRTPLHSIIGFSEVLMQQGFGALNEKQAKFVNTIVTSGKHLLHLVNNILDLAKIEAGKAQLSYEKFILRDTIEEVFAVIRPLAERKQIKVDISVESIPDFTADKVKFKQVLYNLLSNAIKFTPEAGGVGIKAERIVNDGRLLWAPKAQEFLKVCVWDTGPGIKPENREKIFEEFEQLDPSKATEGTGLGLSLTKKLIEIHGGHISVGERGGEKGSVFEIYLPFISMERQAFPPREASTQAGAVEETKEGKALVLVVEDDLPTVELLTIHLTQAGYRVAHAYDGEEAIRKAQELKPFVITLDIMLPKKDGWEVLQALKADPGTKDIPVVIHSIIDNAELAFALGATDYLIKPVDQATLLEKLKGLTQESKKKRYPVSVLLISSDPYTRDSFYRSLKDEGMLLHSAEDEEDGVEMAIATRPNAVIVDVEKPEKGFNFVKIFRENPFLKEMPVFVLTSKEFLPEHRQILTGQMERILSKDALSSGELVNHLRNLELLYPEKAGLLDDVTMLFNARYLRIRLGQELKRSSRHKIPLVFMLTDIDNLDRYVSSKGEYYGNLVLKKTTDLIKRNIRGSDVLTRYGRNTFGLILTNTLVDSGVVLAKRFLSTICDYPFLFEEAQEGGRFTLSVGASVYGNQNIEALIQIAEAALFNAKSKGGNKIEIFHDLPK